MSKQELAMDQLTLYRELETASELSPQQRRGRTMPPEVADKLSKRILDDDAYLDVVLQAQENGKVPNPTLVAECVVAIDLIRYYRGRVPSKPPVAGSGMRDDERRLIEFKRKEYMTRLRNFSQKVGVLISKVKGEYVPSKSSSSELGSAPKRKTRPK